MTLEPRVARLEEAFIQITSVLGEHTSLLREHGQLLRDVVTLLNAQGEQLGRIERAIRERGTNGRRT